jgi:hypothetical protein
MAKRQINTTKDAIKYLMARKEIRTIESLPPLRRIHLSGLTAVKILLADGYSEKKLCDDFYIDPQAFKDMHKAAELKLKRENKNQKPKNNFSQIDDILEYIEEVKRLVIALKSES